MSVDRAFSRAWVHAVSDGSAGNTVWMMGDGEVDGNVEVQLGVAVVGDGFNGNAGREEHRGYEKDCGKYECSSLATRSCGVRHDATQKKKKMGVAAMGFVVSADLKQ